MPEFPNVFSLQDNRNSWIDLITFNTGKTHIYSWVIEKWSTPHHIYTEHQSFHDKDFIDLVKFSFQDDLKWKQAHFRDRLLSSKLSFLCRSRKNSYSVSYSVSYSIYSLNNTNYTIFGMVLMPATFPFDSNQRKAITTFCKYFHGLSSKKLVSIIPFLILQESKNEPQTILMNSPYIFVSSSDRPWLANLDCRI